MAIFFRCSVAVIMANWETSAEEPAVVRYAYERRAWRRNLVYSFIVVDMTAIGDHNTDTFGTIHRAAAANGNNHVALGVLEHLNAAHHF